MNEDVKALWRPYQPDQSKGLCEFESPDMRYRFYAKWDGELHFWFYDDPAPVDIRKTFGKRDQSDYYWYIGELEELDEMIRRLQSIKETARAWFAERGERWPPDWDSYINGKASLEKITTLSVEVSHG